MRRRRHCDQCGRRFTTYERADATLPLIVKKDGGREPFDRQKIVNGLLRACEKRPVPVKTLEMITDRVEAMVQETPDHEVPSQQIGEYLMERLRELDKVAYVRFASVYRKFEDVDEFLHELKNLIGRGDKVAT